MRQINKYLNAEGKLTSLLPSPITWANTVKYVQELPYGRNSSRYDPSLVLSEMKGTCSSKHAVLKLIADENNIENVKLILCLYKMKASNTPGIDKVLEKYGVEYLPEAHCYLDIEGVKSDFTNPNADLSAIENDLIEESEIQPDQVGEYKVNYHQDYVKKWIEQSGLSFSFSEIWKIREECIQALSGS